jgi:hypothetical protein
VTMMAAKIAATMKMALSSGANRCRRHKILEW